MEPSGRVGNVFEYRLIDRFASLVRTTRRNAAKGNCDKPRHEQSQTRCEMAYCTNKDIIMFLFDIIRCGCFLNSQSMRMAITRESLYAKHTVDEFDGTRQGRHNENTLRLQREEKLHKRMMNDSVKPYFNCLLLKYYTSLVLYRGRCA